jgi:hypothetical protein
VVALLDDHDPVAMTMAPSAMVAAVAMSAEFSAGAVAMVMTMITTATLDYDGLGACN